jgi:hypothetical protein
MEAGCRDCWGPARLSLGYRTVRGAQPAAARPDFRELPAAARETSRMIPNERCVHLEDATCRLVLAGLALEGLWVLRGERDDQVVHGADAGQVG